MEKDSSEKKKDDKGDEAKPPAKQSANQLIRRGITILVLAPSVFYLISVSRISMLFVVYTVLCLCSMEWSGVKRHLKVAVLLCKSGQNGSHPTFSSIGYRNGSQKSHCISKVVGEAMGEDTKKRKNGIEVKNNPVLPSTDSMLVSLASEGHQTADKAVDQGKEAESMWKSKRDAAEEFPSPLHDLDLLSRNMEARHAFIDESEENSPLCNLTVKEFAYPVPTLTTYNFLKHLSWAYLAVAAGWGSLSFLVLFSGYFLIFVGVTIIAHNRLEFKVEEAMDRLLEMGPVANLRRDASEFFSRGSPSPTSSVTSLHEVGMGRESRENGSWRTSPVKKGTVFPYDTREEEAEKEEKTRRWMPFSPTIRRRKHVLDGAQGEPVSHREEVEGTEGLRLSKLHLVESTTTTTTEAGVMHLPPSLFPSFSISSLFYRSEEQAEKAREEQERFARLELSVIVENQPAEQFVDFCLDIFGCVWISLFATSILVYDIPVIGFPWVCATLAGNFANDIMALIVGRTVKGIKEMFFFPHLQGSGVGKAKRGSEEEDKNGRGGRRDCLGKGGSRLSTPKSFVKCTPRGKESTEEGSQRLQPGEQDANEKREGVSTSGGMGSTTPTVAKKGTKSRFAWRERMNSFMAGAPHPLYLTVSPNKSVEGAIAGVLCNTLVFTLILCCWHTPAPSLSSRDGASGSSFFGASSSHTTVSSGEMPSSLAFQGVPPIPRYHCFLMWVLAGFILGVAGVVGDLLQSLLKRVSRVKDTGNLLPGHGGMLDRVDGLLLAFPTMFCLVHIVLAMG